MRFDLNFLGNTWEFNCGVTWRNEEHCFKEYSKTYQAMSKFLVNNVLYCLIARTLSRICLEFFFQCFCDFYSYEFISLSDARKNNKIITLCNHNGSWHEMLNSLHVYNVSLSDFTNENSWECTVQTVSVFVFTLNPLKLIKWF